MRHSIPFSSGRNRTWWHFFSFVLLFLFFFLWNWAYSFLFVCFYISFSLFYYFYFLTQESFSFLFLWNQTIVFYCFCVVLVPFPFLFGVGFSHPLPFFLSLSFLLFQAFLTNKSNNTSMKAPKLHSATKEELYRGWTCGKELSKHNSRIHTAYTKNTSLSARPWTLYDFFLI